MHPGFYAVMLRFYDNIFQTSCRKLFCTSSCYTAADCTRYFWKGFVYLHCPAETIAIYMDTNNWNEKQVRLKMLPVNTSIWRFGSVQKEVSFRTRGVVYADRYSECHSCTHSFASCLELSPRVTARRALLQLIVFPQAANIARRKQNKAFKHTLVVCIIKRNYINRHCGRGEEN